MSPWFAATLVLPISVALAGITPSSDGPPPVKPKLVVVKATDVSATEYKWSPADVTVSPGDTVRFEQTTATPHNVEFKGIPAGTKLGPAAIGPFLIKAGDTYDVVIDQRFAAGKHEYVCTPHATMGMKGSITVGAGK